MRPTHLSLFSGIGGLDLAAEAAGFETVGQCEWADYPTKILEKHWPDVPRWRDIRTLTGEDFRVRAGLRTVDVISGGFPCQPFSVAGKQKGRDDDRYLWPEMLRVIRELAPGWVVGENVPGILRLAAGEVVESLEREGYHVCVFAFEAAAVGAPHRRERVAFVAHADAVRRLRTGRSFESRCDANEEHTAVSKGENVAHAGRAGLQGIEQYGEPDAGERQPKPCRPTRQRRETLPDTEGTERDRREPHAEPSRGGGFANGCPIRIKGQWAVEPDVGRVAHGVSNRVDRIKCLGNAVVPQQFFPIFRAIYEEIQRGATPWDR